MMAMDRNDWNFIPNTRQASHTVRIVLEQQIDLPAKSFAIEEWVAAAKKTYGTAERMRDAGKHVVQMTHLFSCRDALW